MTNEISRDDAERIADGIKSPTGPRVGWDESPVETIARQVEEDSVREAERVAADEKAARRANGQETADEFIERIRLEEYESLKALDAKYPDTEPTAPAFAARYGIDTTTTEQGAE